MNNNFSEKDKSAMGVLGRIISIILHIGRIALYIAIPFIALSIILMPIIIKKTTISNDNTITFKYDRETAKVVKEKGKYIIYSNDKKVGDISNTTTFEKTINDLKEYKKPVLIGYMEIILTLSLAYIVIVTLYFKKLEQFFKSFYTEKTPFTKENTDRLRKVGYLLIINVLISLILRLVVYKFDVSNFDISLPVVDVIKILGVYVFMFVFKYGESIENK